MDNLVLSLSYGILEVQFKEKCGNYKIINAITTEFEKNSYVSGIVDSKNMEIFPFQPEIEIKYIGGNNFFIKKDAVYYHYKINSKGTPILKNSFENYKKINHNHYFVSQDGKEAVYNLNEKGPYFSSLSAFHVSEKYNKPIASFVDTIELKEKENIELVGMIDLENHFTNNSIYNITEDEFISISSKEEYEEYCTSLCEEAETKKSLGSTVKQYIKSVLTFDKKDKN